jgi:threonine dehydratase
LATRTVPTLVEIQEARTRIDGIARVTPVYGSGTFSRMCSREVWLKAENLQLTGAFKVRGAVNKIATLSEDEKRAGVVAASAGNHGQAVAWAAREAGAQATIFVPQDAPMAKVDAARNYGAKVELVGEYFEQALDAARAYVEESGATFVHPFEDPAVIAGQGTIGLELMEQVRDIEVVVVPVGGGGLIGGIALGLRELNPKLRVVGVRAGLSGYTIADGIWVKHPTEFTKGILDDFVDDVVDVSDEEISEAIVLLLERSKLVVEGAGAVGIAALLAGKVGGSGPVAVVLSGGNIDPTLLISVMRHGLTHAGRYLVVRTRVADRPGELARLLALLGKERVNVVSVEHHREGVELEVAETEVELTLITRDRAHRDEVLEMLRGWGYEVEPLS